MPLYIVRIGLHRLCVHPQRPVTSFCCASCFPHAVSLLRCCTALETDIEPDGVDRRSDRRTHPVSHVYLLCPWSADVESAKKKVSEKVLEVRITEFDAEHGGPLDLFKRIIKVRGRSAEPYTFTCHPVF